MAFSQKYITHNASGGNGDIATPWTLAEFLTNGVAGDIGNVKNSGAYSLGADAFSNAGTQLSAIMLRGYNSVINDLNGSRSNSNGTLITTDYPAITLTGILTPSVYSIMQNLNFTGALSSTLIGNTVSTDNFTIINCKILNTQNNSAAIALQGDNFVQAINCDIECSGAASAATVDLDTDTQILYCRIKSAGGNGVQLLDGVVVGNLFIGAGGAGQKAIRNLVTGGMICIAGNTIYNWGVVLETTNAAQVITPILANNHITDCTKYIDALYAGTANGAFIEVNNRTRDNATPRTGVGDWPVIGEITQDNGGAGTDYKDTSADDFSLIQSAAGREAGLWGNRDVGAFQSLEPNGLHRRLVHSVRR